MFVSETKHLLSLKIQELLSEPARDTESSDNIKPGTWLSWTVYFSLLLLCHKSQNFFSCGYVVKKVMLLFICLFLFALPW